MPILDLQTAASIAEEFFEESEGAEMTPAEFQKTSFAIRQTVALADKLHDLFCAAYQGKTKPEVKAV